MIQLFFLLSLFLCIVFGDIYMHNPRGSNNRNRGGNANVDNDQRLFDSQNNGKGGYCWGPPMTFYSGSQLQIEWTAQHGCGLGHPKVSCDVIIQFMCHKELRDGIDTGTINKGNKDTEVVDPKTGEKTWKYGMHEPYDYFEKCAARKRNGGLFIADQDIDEKQKATRTRQENNNAPHGFECEEEKDYYPYWHPNPWRDIAILTSRVDKCAYYKEHSHNTASKWDCSKPEHNNLDDCVDAGGTWHRTPSWNLPPPDCKGAEYSRVNHLGNTIGGETSSYTWTIPTVEVIGRDSLDGGIARCALRIRYNISTEDYPHWHHDQEDKDGNPIKDQFIDSKFNGKESPVKQNPYVGYGKDKAKVDWDLSIALNTDQYGRTFQDRSHMFFIKERPAGVDKDARLVNLNVRGKRGNVVETFPATEYDFVPTDLELQEGDLLHFQWTGCDTNPNYAGEGTQKTDRHNVVELLVDNRHNLPFTKDDKQFEKAKMFTPEIAFKMAHLNQYDGKQCKNAGETKCCKSLEQLKKLGNNANANVQNCAKLNDVNKQYFDGGIHELKVGEYHYMCTRNNNFSNRSQKGRISVLPK